MLAMRNWLLLILTLLIVSSNNAQTSTINSQKYNDYRERLRSEFMFYSPNNLPGSNLPASTLNVEKNKIQWGDATIILSLYMGTLATEYKLRKKNNQDYNESLYDLYYAMQALERLDMSAEMFYDSKLGLTYPNGFFIRDDLSGRIKSQLPDKHDIVAKRRRVQSDYTSKTIRNNEMSQDQVWHLLIGLSLVESLVDDTTKFRIYTKNGTTKVKLNQWARIITSRIIKSLQTKVYFNLFNIKWLPISAELWFVTNPVTGEEVKRGAWPTMLKYGFARAGYKITKGEFGTLHWGNSRNAKIWFKVAAILQRVQSVSKSGQWGDIYHIGALATVGNIWSSTKLVRLYNHHHKKLFVKDTRYEHFALISILLHGGNKRVMRNEKEFYLDLLNKAPAGGPFNYGYTSQRIYTREWSSVSRIIWPERLGENMREFSKGDYNGLDYMLLYNMYRLVFESELLKK